MGFFSWLFSQPTSTQLPVVSTILPSAAENEIRNGRLPHLNTDTIFTQKHEHIHYIDKAILLKDKTKKHYQSRRTGFSTPGIFNGDRIYFGGGTNTPVEEIVTEKFKGVLYITNRRAVFVSKKNGFDKPFRSLSAITPYSNGIELQYGSTTYSLIVPDGDLLNAVFKLIN